MRGATIVIPTYNRIASLQKCIAAVVPQLRADDELLVINDASTDTTRGFLDSITDPRVRIIHHVTNRKLAAAKNSGIKAAQKNVIAFVDDDCVPEKNWLNEVVADVEQGAADFVFGKTFYRKEGYRGHFPERLVGNNNGSWPGGGNIAFSKKVFAVCGDFSAWAMKLNNEDTEMAIRAITQGFRFKKNPQAIVVHEKQNWRPLRLLRSSRNASIWPILKKRYPKTYRTFGGPATTGIIVHPFEYILILLLPILIPLQLILFLSRGNTNLILFFTKWPTWLLLKRLWIWYESLRNRVLLF